MAIVILIAQLPSLLGLREIPTTIDNSLDKLFWTLKNIRHTHFLSLAISIVALLVLIFAKVVKAKLQTRRGFRHLAFIPESVRSSSPHERVLTRFAECSEWSACRR